MSHIVDLYTKGAILSKAYKKTNPEKHTLESLVRDYAEGRIELDEFERRIEPLLND